MLHVHVECVYFYISRLNSEVYLQCPIWLFAVVPLFHALPVCYSGSFWMILRWFQLLLLLLVSLLFLHSTSAVFLLLRPVHIKIFRLHSWSHFCWNLQQQQQILLQPPPPPLLILLLLSPLLILLLLLPYHYYYYYCCYYRGNISLLWRMPGDARRLICTCINSSHYFPWYLFDFPKWFPTLRDLEL